MKPFWEYYLKKHFSFGDIFRHNSHQDIYAEQVKPKGFPVIKVLKWIPLSCIIMFLAGLMYDFEDIAPIQYNGYSVNFTGILKIVSMSGIIGYFTNYLAIKMLFYPKNKHPIWGQGLIPAQKQKITLQFASAIHEHVVNENFIKSKLIESKIPQKLAERVVSGIKDILSDREFLSELSQETEKMLEDYLQRPEIRTKLIQELDKKLKSKFNKGLSRLLLKSYTSLNATDYQATLNKTIDEIPPAVSMLIENPAPHLSSFYNLLENKHPDIENKINDLFISILDNLNIQHWLKIQLDKFDEAKLETMIERATSEQLQYIQYLGGVLGMFGGLILWQPIPMLLITVVLLGILFGLDTILYRKLKKFK